MSEQTIWVVDDEANICELVRLYLERDRFEVVTFSNGSHALERFAEESPDMLILDLMLPGADGYEVCRQIRGGQRNKDVPILMLTARTDDVDKIVGLEMGADDYMTKPFNPREVVARVKAILRRVKNESTTPLTPQPSTIRIGDLHISPAQREARHQGKPLDLRAKEFDLLHVLAQHLGIVLSREQLLELVWGFNFYGQTRTVDVHVGQLRKALTVSNVQIETVTGIGYKLVAPR